MCLCACKHDSINKSAAPTRRTYRMGFQNLPPKPDMAVAQQAINLWVQRSDAAIISIPVPWAAIYSGTSPQQYVQDNFVDLVSFYRTKNLKLWVYIDPANGLDRTADAADLVALHKSIAQPAVQKVYSRFVFVMDSILKPEHLGLALETNAIRGTSPDSIYQGIKAAVNHTAPLISAYDKNVKLSVSIQADFAWGLLTGTAYQGIDKDFVDFPFIQELGISSYPYFVFDTPQNIPANYYSRLTAGHNIPVFISEGGWSSQTVYKYTGTQQKQQDYITKQSQLLDGVNAIGYFQLLFSDLNVAAYSGGITGNIGPFSFIGLTDTVLNAKPALTTWDNVFKRPLTAGH